MENCLWFRTSGASEIMLEMIPEEDPEWVDFNLEIRNEYLELNNGFCMMKNEVKELLELIESHLKHDYKKEHIEFKNIESNFTFILDGSKFTDFLIQFREISDKYILSLYDDDLIKIKNYLEKEIKKYL